MKKKRFLLILVFVVVFVMIFILNNNTQFVTDDFTYHFVFEGRYPTESTRLLSNPLDIFVSMGNHWKLWGGRIGIHFLLQLAFLIGTNFFNVFNSIMFLLLGYLIYKHINKGEIKLTLLVSIYAAIFLFIPQPGDTFLWKSGSANYLWSSVFLLIMTLILKNKYEKKYDKDNYLFTTAMFLYSIFVGNMNENSGCALLIAIILFMVFYKIRDKYVPRYLGASLLGTFIGYIILVSSPGNHIRADEMYPAVQYNITDIISNIMKLTSLSYKYMGVIMFIVIITSIMIFKKQKNLKEYVNKYGIQLIFIIYSIVSIYSLVVSPAYPERCWMFAFIYSIIIIGINLSNINYGKDYILTYNKIILMIMFIFSIMAINSYNEAYYDIVDTKLIIRNHVSYIEKEKKKGNKNIKIKFFANTPGKYNAFAYNGYLTIHPDSWTNKWIAEYYGIDSIEVEE